jgi:hypothetical protein
MSHTIDIPDALWDIGVKLSGKPNPASFFRNLLIKAVNVLVEEHNAAKREQKAEQQPKPNPLVKPELHVAVDWDQYGMGFDIEDPDFTDIILPWFIEIKGGEKEAEARILEKLAEPNPITNPRKWVSGLYYKNKKRDAG